MLAQNLGGRLASLSQNTLTHEDLATYVFLNKQRCISCRLFGVKRIPEPLVTHCQMDTTEQNVIEIWGQIQ